MSNANIAGLGGKRVLVTAYDLEQGEHRGIAVFSKALIRCLHNAGAEVWLLTGFSPFASASGKGMKLLPKRTSQLIQTAVLLESLAKGQQITKTSLLERRFAFIRRIITWRNRFLLAIAMLQRPRTYRKTDTKKISLKKLFDNPYLRMERLSYLHHLEGIVTAPGIFMACQTAAMLDRQKPVRVDVSDFDVLLTSCPLNLQPLPGPILVQTIHDLIPLEYFAHNEDQLMFTHRLQACIPARRLYVSEATAHKFHERILKTETATQPSANHCIEPIERVIVQPPSLIFPDHLLANPSNVGDFEPGSYLLRQDPDEPDPKEQEDGQYDHEIFKKSLKKWVERPINRRARRMRPFRYVLFNSSVEARKNLFLMAEAYAQSGLSSQGIHLCVTGKLKNDDYSNAVKEIVRQEQGILLTGYVDEATKLDLYLNALALLSPSLVEGFGIPVLDAACLGLPAVVSDSVSHLEIANLNDFSDSVFPLSPLKSRDWADAMAAFAGLGSQLWIPQQAAAERKRRITRYEHFRVLFMQKLQSDLADVCQR